MALGKSVFQDQINDLKTFTEINIRNMDNQDPALIFAKMVTKKTIEILYTASYAYTNRLLDVLLSMIRLLQDNSLAIESAKELGFKTYIKCLIDNKPINLQPIPEKYITNNPNNPQNLMTDGHVRDMIGKQYKGFINVYRFTSKSVHFNGQSFNTILIPDEEGNKKLTFGIGNKEKYLEKNFIWSKATIETLAKIIFDMLQKTPELGLLTK